MTELRPYQERAREILTNCLATHGSALDASDCGCHPAGTEILLSSGDAINVEDVAVGDVLIDDRGRPTTVISLKRGFGNLFKINPNKGTGFIANEEHVLTLYSYGDLHNRLRVPELVDISIKDWFSWNKTKRSMYKLRRGSVGNLWKTKVKHPYLMGLSLGDGCLGPSLVITTKDPEIKHICLTEGAVERLYSNRCPEYAFPTSTPIVTEIKRAGLWGRRSADKFIPQDYKTGSEHDRWELLAGLIDSDGSLAQGCFDWISKSRRLAEDLCFVCRSLGLAAYMKPCIKSCQTGATGTYYRVCVSGHTNRIPCRIPRKRAAVRHIKKDVLNVGFHITPVGQGAYFGFSLSGSSRYLLADFTITHNSGKTYTACAIAAQLNRPIAIVCPKSVITNWTRIAKQFGVTPIFILNYEKLRTGNTPYLDNINGLMFWKLPFNTLIVWDEVHKCKAFNSLNSKMLVAAKNNAQYYLNLMLSATAAESPLDMRALGYILDLHKYNDFWQWAFANGVSKNRWNEMKFNGDRNILKNIHEHIFSNGNRGYRIRIADLGDSFPDNEVHVEACDVGHEKEIDAAYESALTEVQGRSLTELRKRGIVSLRGRQVAEKYKIPVLAELAQEIRDEGKSVAIFVNFKESVSELCRLLKTDCVVVGGQTPDERQHFLDRFQSNKDAIIICNIQAGGQSINLHDVHNQRPRVSLICPTFSAVDLQQALGRIYRNGATSKCIQKIVFAAGTVEDGVCEAVKRKRQNIDTLNDQDLI